MERTSTDEQRRSFAEALKMYLQRANMRPADLMRALQLEGFPARQASVSQWTTGQVEPVRHVVYAMERLLNLQPGLLSRHLGYLPTFAVSISPVDVETALLADDRLTPDQRQLLLATYRTLIGL
jgi:hypothetical protein